MASRKRPSGKMVAKVLENEGYRNAGQKGSHITMKAKIEGELFITTVPISYREIGPGLLNRIISGTHLSKKEFKKKLKDI